MRMITIALALLLAACSDSNGPAGHDPTVLITNSTDWPLHFEWRDGAGVVGADTVPGHVERCERFFARPDSAYFYADITDPTHGTSTYTQPWFDPIDRPVWAMAVTAGTGSPLMVVRDSSGGAVVC